MFGGAHHQRLEDVATQGPAVGVGDVGNSALTNGGVQLGEANPAAMYALSRAPQSPVCPAHLARLDQAMARIDDEAEPRDAGRPPAVPARGFRG